MGNLHSTQAGEILFMAAKRAFLNKMNGKEEFSIKLKLSRDDKAVKHIEEVADYKINTKNNFKLMSEGSNDVIVNFVTKDRPLFLDADNNEIVAEDIPAFDSRIDKGKAAAIYSVLEFTDKETGANKTVVRLSGIKLVELVQGERKNDDKKGNTLSIDELKKNIDALGL